MSSKESFLASNQHPTGDRATITEHTMPPPQLLDTSDRPKLQREQHEAIAAHEAAKTKSSPGSAPHPLELVDTEPSTLKPMKLSSAPSLSASNELLQMPAELEQAEIAQALHWQTSSSDRFAAVNTSDVAVSDSLGD